MISYGENYDGTPVGEGITALEGMEQPVYFWDPVIAPGGMMLYQGGLFADWQGDMLVASLTQGAIVRLELADNRVVGEERLALDRGRVRDLDVDAAGAILVLTDEADGKLLRLTPAE